MGCEYKCVPDVSLLKSFASMLASPILGGIFLFDSAWTQSNFWLTASKVTEVVFISNLLPASSSSRSKSPLTVSASDEISIKSDEILSGFLQFARREQGEHWQGYISDLEAIDWNSISRLQLVSQDSVIPSQKIVQRVLEFAVEFESDLYRAEETVMWQIAMLDATSAQKDLLYSQFQTEFRADFDLTTEWFETEFAFIETVSEALHFLRRYQSSWYFEDLLVHFNEPHLNEEFGKLMQKSEEWRQKRLNLEQQLTELLSIDGAGEMQQEY